MYDALEFLTLAAAQRFRRAAEQIEATHAELAQELRETANDLTRVNQDRVATEGLLLLREFAGG
jgi:ribosome-binding protein aMBF1 (putative translation factor)